MKIPPKDSQPHHQPTNKHRVDSLGKSDLSPSGVSADGQSPVARMQYLEPFAFPIITKEISERFATGIHSLCSIQEQAELCKMGSEHANNARHPDRRQTPKTPNRRRTETYKFEKICDKCKAIEKEMRNDLSELEAKLEQAFEETVKSYGYKTFDYEKEVESLKSQIVEPYHTTRSFAHYVKNALEHSQIGGTFHTKCKHEIRASLDSQKLDLEKEQEHRLSQLILTIFLSHPKALLPSQSIDTKTMQLALSEIVIEANRLSLFSDSK